MKHVVGSIEKFKTNYKSISTKSKEFINMAKVYKIHKPSAAGVFDCGELSFEELGFCSIQMDQIKMVVNKDSLK